MTLDVEKIKETLKFLKSLPKIKEVKELTKRLQSEEKKILSTTNEKPKSSETKISANKIRSSKAKKYWSYIRKIHQNFPQYTISQIRNHYSQRKQGKHTTIPDAIWQNPSP